MKFPDDLTVGSLFAGIGGFDLAFERAGFRVAWQVEIDPKCRQVLQHHFPGSELHEDAKTFDPRAAEPVRVLVGGFPCQDLSVAGRRAGLAGEKSGLFWEFARIIEEATPEWVVVENVPGLLSSGGGRDMGTVLGVLDDLGYMGGWRVLDAQYFGVAQRRRRVFLVGRAGKHGAGEVLLEPGGVRRDPPARPEAGTLTSALTRNGVDGGGGPDDNSAQANHLIPAVAGTIGSNGKGFRTSDLDGHGAYIPEIPGVSNALRSQRGQRYDHNEQAFIPTAFHITQELSKGTEQGCSTIAAQTLMGVRRLTPLECERLQGFPDYWTAGQSDSARYRQLGNAVCVPVVGWIAGRMLEHMVNEEEVAAWA